MSRLITRRRSVTDPPPVLSPSTAPAVSALLNGEPTPFTEATAMASQVPLSSASSVLVQSLSARRPHRRCRDSESSVHNSSSSRVEDGGSQPAKKNTRGPNRMLKAGQMVRLSASLIKIAYDSRHRGAATSQQQHSIVATSCGYVIKNCCPMQWESWAEIPKKTKTLVRDKLSVNFDFKDISQEVITSLDETFANRYKNWKSDLHAHFKKWGDPETARLEGCPSELEDLPKDWEWLCNHFTDPKFVKKSIAGKIAQESKTLLHHSGSKPFSYRVEARREKGSKFPEIDMFKDIYVQSGDEMTEQLYAAMVEKGNVVL